MSALALPYTPPLDRDLRSPWSQPWRNCIENEEVDYYQHDRTIGLTDDGYEEGEE